MPSNLIRKIIHDGSKMADENQDDGRNYKWRTRYGGLDLQKTPDSGQI